MINQRSLIILCIVSVLLCICYAYSVLDMCQEADCVSEATCVTADSMDGFLCLCPDGYSGDGRVSGTGCNPNQPGQQCSYTQCMMIYTRSYLRTIDGCRLGLSPGKPLLLMIKSILDIKQLMKVHARAKFCVLQPPMLLN